MEVKWKGGWEVGREMKGNDGSGDERNVERRRGRLKDGRGGFIEGGWKIEG